MDGDSGKSPKLISSERSLRQEIEANRLAQRNHLVAVYLFVSLFLCASWLVGFLGGSLVWVFIMCVVLYITWTTRIGHLVHQYMQQEEVTLHRKRTLKRSESVEWLNFIVNRWWVYSSSTIEDVIKKRLDQRLLKVKPSFVDKIELAHFDLGEQTPFVTNVNMFEYDECQPGGHKSVTWSDIMRPPKGLCTMSKFNLVIEIDVGLLCDDFTMVLRSRIGNANVGVNVDMAVENLNITGKMQVIGQLSMDVPFPHLSKATIYFTQQPDVWFNVRCLHSLQLMELPLIRTWIHTHVMEGLADALVDPGKVELKLARGGPRVITPTKAQPAKVLATAVLTVSTTCTAGSKTGDDDVTYVTTKLGRDKVGSREVVGSGQWHDCSSFFIYNLATEKLLLKHKLKRLLTSTTLCAHELPLSSFPFPIEKTATQDLESSDGSSIHVHLEYTPLRQVDVAVTASEGVRGSDEGSAGVMYIKVHGATGLIAGDIDDSSDPYCVVYCDRKKILTTPYVLRNKSPTWETEVEFFVSDYSKKTYSLFVYDWDGASMLDDDFLGSAFFTMPNGKHTIVRRMLTLGYNRPTEGYIENKDYGVICVSAVFRPVDTVAVSEKYRALDDGVPHATVYQAVPPSPSRLQDSVSRSQKVSNFRERLLEERMFVELVIVSAKDLMAGDRSGFSDPYAEVSVKDKGVYKTSAKKKTLNPQWNETATFYMTADDEFVKITVYDKDFLGHDFLGTVNVTMDELKVMSIDQTSKWYRLEKAKHGEIELRCSVVSKDSAESAPHTVKTPLITVQDINANVADSGRVLGVHEPDNSSNNNEPKVNHYHDNKLSSLHHDNSPTNNHHDNNNDYYPNSMDSPHPSLNADTPTLRNRSKFRLSDKSTYDRPARSVSEMNIANKKARHFFPTIGRPKSSSARANIPIDSMSTVSSQAMNPLEAFFDVKGVLVQTRGLSVPDSDVYCRIRLDRIKHGHSSLRTLAKSDSVRTYFATNFNLMFEVDKGHGISKDALLIVDFKKAKKDTLASRSYALRDIIQDAAPGARIQKWLAYDTDVDLEISLTHSEPDLEKLRKARGGLFKSLSFTRRSQTDINTTT